MEGCLRCGQRGTGRKTSEKSEDGSQEVSPLDLVVGAAERTSVHGVAHILAARNPVVAIVWALITGAAFGTFLMCTVENIRFFQQRGVSRYLRVQRQPHLKFPTITICNLNDYSREFLTRIGFCVPEGLLGVLKEGTKEILCSLDHPEFSNMEIMQRIRTARQEEQLAFIYARLIPDDLANSTQPMEEFISKCSMDGRDCKFSDFTTIYNQRYGACHAFNFHGQTFVNISGQSHGLMLQLNINQTQYTRFTDSAGVRIAVTHHNELVRPDVFGAGISPGKVAFMGIMKTQMSRVPEYEDCETNDSTPRLFRHLYPALKYSTAACIDSCLVLEVLHRCDCIPTGTLLSLYDAHRLSEIRNASQGHKIPLCFQRDAGTTCYLDLLLREAEFKGKCNLKCKVPCTKVFYDVEISTADWPSESREKHMKAKRGNISTAADPYDKFNIRAHMLQAFIYMRTLQVDETSSQMTVTVISMLSNVGGMAGLCLGMSVITVIELLQLGVLICWKWVKSCLNPRNKTSYEMKNTE